MLLHPQFNPIALQIGPVAVHWYGLMYLIGFALFYHLGKQRAQDSWRGVSPRELDDLLFVGVIGVILGGRLGFCLFYQCPIIIFVTGYRKSDFFQNNLRSSFIIRNIIFSRQIKTGAFKQFV